MINNQQHKTAHWWNDRTLFFYHFTRSNYVTATWNWFMVLAGKAAEPFLFASVLYSGYKLLPGVPQPGIGLDAGVFIAQQATLDIGGMGLMKLAQQAKQNKLSFAYGVGCILVGLMIANVILASIERMAPLGNAGNVVEGVLLVARAVMAVLYGHAIHSLRGEESEPENVVKSVDVHRRLDEMSVMLQQLAVDTEVRRQSFETKSEERRAVMTEEVRVQAAKTEGRLQRLETITEHHFATTTQSIRSLETMIEERIGALVTTIETRKTEDRRLVPQQRRVRFAQDPGRRSSRRGHSFASVYTRTRTCRLEPFSERR